MKNLDTLAQLLKVHRNGDELDFKKIWGEGLFIFDSNVFLDLYRLPISARRDLMGVLTNDNFRPRIWTGFQVALEFLNNRHETISDQKNKFHTVKTLVTQALATYTSANEELRSELIKLKLKQRHSLINPDQFINDTNIATSTQYLGEFLDELDRLEKEQFDVHEHDEIKQFVLNLIDGRVGEALDKSTLENIYKEGEKRYENDVPPGYKDKAKKGEYIHQRNSYIRRFGDLILWKEIIKKAKEGKYKYIVLVTGDVKEDWWSEKRGKRLGPRRELLDEIYSEATGLDVFHMYDTSGFLQYAKDYLDATIKESSITETEALIQSNREEKDKIKVEISNLYETLVTVINRFDAGLRIIMWDSIKLVSQATMNSHLWYECIMEILSNSLTHGVGQIQIEALEIGDMIVVRFANIIRSEKIADDPDNNQEKMQNRRIGGLRYLKYRLAAENSNIRSIVDDEHYIVEITLPKSVRSA